MMINNVVNNTRLVLKNLVQVVVSPSGTVNAMKAVVNINHVLKSKKIDVVFFDRFAGHYGFSKPIFDEFMLLGKQALYVTCDMRHCKLKSNDNNRAHYINRKYEFFLRFIKVPLIVTPASNFLFTGKSNKTKIAHFFHSPVSMHYVYSDRAFDSYDIFFAVGPHHTNEIKLLSDLRGWQNKTSIPSGYPKIDTIYRSSLKSPKNQIHKRNKKIAFAPSWLKTSVLRSHGYVIIRDLLDSGFEVVLRPHPHSFEYDLDIINEISEKFHNSLFELDDSENFDKIYECDILISDWSGVAFEFSFSQYKPVLFIDVKGSRKVQSIKNTEIGTQAIEDICRFEVGMVTEPDRVVKNIKDICKKSSSKWSEDIKHARSKYLYNFGKSAEIIAFHIKNLSSNN